MRDGGLCVQIEILCVKVKILYLELLSKLLDPQKWYGIEKKEDASLSPPLSHSNTLTITLMISSSRRNPTRVKIIMDVLTAS